MERDRAEKSEKVCDGFDNIIERDGGADEDFGIMMIMRSAS